MVIKKRKPLDLEGLNVETLVASSEKAAEDLALKNRVQKEPTTKRYFHKKALFISK